VSITTRAVYEGGALHLTEPLPINEGAIVDVTIEQPTSSPMSDEEITRRLQEAKTIVEWVEATKLLPSGDDDYDVAKALDQNRQWSGERPLIPQ
jgi:predicted DNA-binding antitoxin AbrB/MazE fold protein